MEIGKLVENLKKNKVDTSTELYYYIFVYQFREQRKIERSFDIP